MLCMPNHQLYIKWWNTEWVKIVVLREKNHLAQDAELMQNVMQDHKILYLAE